MSVIDIREEIIGHDASTDRDSDEEHRERVDVEMRRLDLRILQARSRKTRCHSACPSMALLLSAMQTFRSPRELANSNA